MSWKNKIIASGIVPAVSGLITSVLAVTRGSLLISFGTLILGMLAGTQACDYVSDMEEKHET